MEYRLPRIEDEDDIRDFIRECCYVEECYVMLKQELLLSDYSKWVSLIHRYASLGNGKWGRSLLLLAYDKSRLVGILPIRYEISEDYAFLYGNIGYHVRPSLRNMGYATKMLKHGLEICKEKGMVRVIVGCDRDNLASSAVIKKCGGVHLRTFNDSYGVNDYYGIYLSSE